MSRARRRGSSCRTAAAARRAFPRRRVVAVFQPHLFSRTALHGDALGRALAAADVVVVAPIYGAREQPLPGVSAALVARGAVRAGATTVALRERATLTELVAETVQAGDGVFTLGGGGIARVGPEAVARPRAGGGGGCGRWGPRGWGWPRGGREAASWRWMPRVAPCRSTPRDRGSICRSRRAGIRASWLYWRCSSRWIRRYFRPSPARGRSRAVACSW